MKVRDSTYWYIPVCTFLYCMVPCGIRRYMAVQDGTLRYNERYRKVQAGTSQYKNHFNCTSRYVLARTYPYCSIRLCFPAEFAAAILPGRQLCIPRPTALCIHSHQCKRKQDLIKSTGLFALAILGGSPRLLGGGGGWAVPAEQLRRMGARRLRRRARRGDQLRCLLRRHGRREGRRALEQPSRQTCGSRAWPRVVLQHRFS